LSCAARQQDQIQITSLESDIIMRSHSCKHIALCNILFYH